MIVTKLQGGLGNQLFQWAISENLSIKFNSEVYYDLSYFRNFNDSKVSKWNLELDKFDINVNEFKGQVNLKIINDNFHYRYIEDNSYLNGYWQSEKYFIENEKTIRTKLKIKDELESYILNKYPFLNSNTVSLHIRRGDYVNLQNYHPLQKVEYYKKAYDIINDSSINVIILSNDIEWCKENLNFNNMFFIENETNIVDLYIMSKCRNNIIANSSFSWWGAWLNSNVDKKVIAPSKWFGSQAGVYENDMVPEKWIKI